MQFKAPLTTFALLASATLIIALPTCSTNSPTPCTCPAGTSYSESTTSAIIGAALYDVKAVTGDFFNTNWLGISPFNFQGTDNQPGATRAFLTYNLPSTVGIYGFTEQLTQSTSNPNGFIQKFEQLASTLPIKYHSGKGSFNGYWTTLEAHSASEHQTKVELRVYSCATGHPIDFARFYEFALTDATKALKREGKLLGASVAPHST